MTSLRFLLLTHFEPHFEYFSDLDEATEFEHYATRNLLSLSRFFPDFSVEWTLWRYEDFDQKQSDEMLLFDAVFIGGSPWNVSDGRDWMMRQTELFHHFFHHQIFPPVFGICFGHQFLACFFGGEVRDLSKGIKKEMQFLWNGQTITSWANHKQYVSKIPDHATVHVWADTEKTIPYVIQFEGRVWGIQSHVELNLEDEPSELFWGDFFRKKILGHSIGTTIVDGIELLVEFYPNDRSEVSRDLQGNYLGKKGYCVELVRRFLYLKTGINFANRWQDGHAQDWYANAEIMGLEKIENTQHLKEGDILCFSGGLSRFGHVALVQKVQKEGIWIAQQNCFQDERDCSFFLPFKHFDFQGFVYQGGLRRDALSSFV